jgi:hypothetical protein
MSYSCKLSRKSDLRFIYCKAAFPFVTGGVKIWKVKNGGMQEADSMVNTSNRAQMRGSWWEE